MHTRVGESVSPAPTLLSVGILTGQEGFPCAACTLIILSISSLTTLTFVFFSHAIRGVPPRFTRSYNSCDNGDKSNSVCFQRTIITAGLKPNNIYCTLVSKTFYFITLVKFENNHFLDLIFPIMLTFPLAMFCNLMIFYNFLAKKKP